MTISKGAREARFVRPAFHFDSARLAFRAFLEAADIPDGAVVLLPAFIGWSANEGSGVFDPVRELGLMYRFYPMTDDLRIDPNALRAELDHGDVAVLVLIHYFGFPDPLAANLAALAQSRGVLVLEDEAHAMLTDVVGGASGRDGDAAIFSLHKMLPVPAGGTLLLRGDALAASITGGPAGVDPWAYDLHRIAARRVANAAAAAEAVEALRGDVTPLWDEIPAGVVPQTFPVVIETVSRDTLYFGMNAAGFGVVSLYHTMITEIGDGAFPAARRLARRILNLPVHQDARPDEVRACVAELGRQITALRSDA